jgi:hypothetical protein
LRHPAVFATVPCPFQDLLTNGVVHGSRAAAGLLQGSASL